MIIFDETMRKCLILLSFTTIIAGVAMNTCVAQQSPYPPSPVIKGIEFNWSTHLRLATGSDNWPATWADDEEMKR